MLGDVLDEEYHVYAVICHADDIWFYDSNRQPLETSYYIHQDALKSMLEHIYTNANITRPEITTITPFYEMQPSS